MFPYSYSVLLLLVSRQIFDLSAQRFILCPHLHLSFAFLAAHFSGHLSRLLGLLEPRLPPRNTRFLHNVFSISTFTNLHTKPDVYPLARFLSLIFPPTAYRGHVLHSMLFANERLIGSVAPNVLGYMRLPDTTHQQHAATIPGIKLPHLFRRKKAMINLKRII
jgi:hypothetical protein